MSPTPTNLWLYLARRDSRGVRVLTVVRGRPQTAVRISDLSLLQLPPSRETEIQRIVDEHKMMWEPFLEAAEPYEILRAALKKRGFKNLPLNGQPEFTRTTTTPDVNVARLPQQNTMLRRGS